MHKRAQAAAATLMSGQALIVSLWILLALTVITINIAHRVSFSLRLSVYQRDRLKAVCLAKAGINRAIAEIKKDDPACDSLKDKWADNEDVFKKVVLDANTEEFFSVSYAQMGDDEQLAAIYGARDEESKINLNKASGELLTALLEAGGAVSADAIQAAKNIRAWRGDIGAPVPPDYQELLGYDNKGKYFSNPEELILVKGITSEIYNAVKSLITACEDNQKVNINTADYEVLKVIARSGVIILGNPSIIDIDADSLAARIVNFRKGDDNTWGTSDDIVLDDSSDIDSFPQNSQITGTSEEAIFNAVKGIFSVATNYFRIESIGNAGRIKSKVSVVYKRGGKILYWYES